MKKLIIYLSFISLFSCSKEDVNYAIVLEAACPNGSSPVLHCVSKSTYEAVKSSTGDRCTRVTFTDLDGNGQSGYYTGSSSGESACE